MGIFSGKNVNKRRAVGCTSIILALGLVYLGIVTWKGAERQQYGIPVGQQAAGQLEGTNDCFIPKKGDAPCVRDMVGARFEWAETDGECEGVRATVQTDADLESLDSEVRGEVVMQIHPRGGSNDGSADTGIGIGRYSEWMVFRFGPGGARLPGEVGSAQIEGQNVSLQLNNFHDGSCITEDSEMRIKLQFDDSSGDPIYDILGFSGGLMEYHSVKEYMEVFGSR